MNDPLVSIVVPAYNAASSIREMIESVVGQTYSNWELLVIDDGSTDDTVARVRDWSLRDARIKVVPMDQNSGGPAGPRNVGMRQARGEYIAFLDADDIWFPEKLRKQVAFMEEYTDVFLVYSQFVYFANGKRIGIEPRKLFSGKVYGQLMTRFNFIPILTVMMRNRKRDNPYFYDEDKRLVAVEDYDFCLNIAFHEKIAFIAEPLGAYRADMQGISAGAFGNFSKCSVVLGKFWPCVPLWLSWRSRACYGITLAAAALTDLLILIKYSVLGKVCRAARSPRGSG